MNERLVKIIEEIITNRSLKVSDISKNLSLTKRQVLYSLTQINDYLTDKNLPTIKRNSKGEFQYSSEIYQILSRDFHYSDFYSVHSRHVLIYTYIFISQGDVSLNHITEILNTSKNTIVNDIKELNKILKPKNISIEFNRIDGYRLVGNEFAIRLCMNQFLHNMKKMSIDFESITEEIHQFKNQSLQLIRSMEKEYGIRYSDDSFEFLINALILSFIRSNIRSIEFTDPYRILDKSFEFLVLNNVKFVEDEQERLWLALLFITSNLFINKFQSFNDKNYHLFPELNMLVDQMIVSFENQTLTTIDNKNDFKQRLLMHLRLAVFRIMYDIELEGVAMDVVYREELSLEPIIKVIISPLEKLINKDIPENELKLITLYFESQIGNISTRRLNRRAAVVCTNGVVVSKVLLSMLTKLFPEINIVLSVSVREFESIQEDW